LSNIKSSICLSGSTDQQSQEVLRGKDFIQLKNGPFDLDLVFAPDGIERFEDAWRRRTQIEGFPVCHIDDIILSKQAANRSKAKNLYLDFSHFEIS
jgi:hypothetical protein